MNSDPLAQLKDIHTPEAVGWWPPAPLWWLLALMVLLLLGWQLWRLHKKRAHNRYRRQALALLQDIPSEASSEQCQAVNQLLKRTAISAFGERCSHLSGDQWLAFLDATLPGSDGLFSEGPGRVLASGPYRPQPDYEPAPLLTAAARWIAQHRPPAGEDAHV